MLELQERRIFAEKEKINITYKEEKIMALPHNSRNKHRNKYEFSMDSCIQIKG